MAQRPAAESTVYACLTHVELPMQFPSQVVPIYLGQAQRPGRLNLRDLAPEWEPFHPVLGGTAGAFALKNLLVRDRPEAVSVGICQYRKFVSRERVSLRVADNYPAMDVVSARDLPVDRLAQLLKPGPEPFVVSRFLKPRQGYLADYGKSHLPEDLLRFAAEAAERGVLAKDEVYWFLREELFIPGGIELGIFPARFWIEHITALESVVRGCVARYPEAREGYQMRAWAFCAERLGSWMLLRHFRGRIRPPRMERWHALSPRHWRRRFIGHLNIVDNSGAATYVPGTS